MTQIKPRPAYIELHDKQVQEVDRRPDLLRRMERGDDDVMGDADSSLRELEREAERNGYSLSVDLAFCEMKKDSICRKMTPEAWEQDRAWEKEEESEYEDHQRIQDGT